MTTITLAQINPRVSQVSENLKKIQEVVAQAPDGSLVVFPEMVVTGYPLDDLALSRSLQKESESAVASLLNWNNQSSKSIVLGTLSGPSKSGGLPHNSSVFTGDGVNLIAHKTALPTFGVFDESRTFAAGSRAMRFKKDGRRFIVLICEDMWEENSDAMQSAYIGADVVIVINGSPYEPGKIEKRVEMVQRVKNTARAELAIYVNLVGGQDDIVFDGRSFVMNDKGIVANLKAFEEDVVSFDIDELIQSDNVETEDFYIPRIECMYRAAVLGLRDYMIKNGMKKATLGASGGIDSALVLTMAADAVGGENILGVAMPSKYSSEHSKSDAESLMKNLGGEYRVVPISDMFDSFMNAVTLTGIAEENLQARIRGVVIMGISNEEGHLVLAPGNKSEVAVGYSTIYGDAVGGYAPIKDIYKTDIYEMSRWRNTLSDAPIPVSSIEKPPSAELKPGQVDQESLPPYEILDPLLYDHIENRLDGQALIEKHGKVAIEIVKKVNRAEWKRRQYPIGPKLSTMSFGRERVIPITR